MSAQSAEVLEQPAALISKRVQFPQGLTSTCLAAKCNLEENHDRMTAPLSDVSVSVTTAIDPQRLMDLNS